MRCDIIIIGGGVIGCSTAYHLKRGGSDLSILLLERNPRIGMGNTGKSAALYRNLFSSRTSRMLASSSIGYYRELGEAIGLRSNGYLWMFSKEQWAGSKGALSSVDPNDDELEVLDREAISDMLNINMDGGPFPDIDRAIFGHRCGSLSAMALAKHYAEEFVSMGGEIRTGVGIDRIELTGAHTGFAPWEDIRVEELVGEDGTSYTAGKYVSAVGAWTPELLTPAGIFSGVMPKKRQLFGIEVEDGSGVMRSLAPDRAPVMVLPAGGAYIKPLLDRNMMIVGLADKLGQPYSMGPPEPDESYFHSAVAPVIDHYFPYLKGYTLKMKWAGHYSYHWPDMNPVIESVANLTWVSGTSGSGIMKGDAIGRIASARVLGQEIAKLYDGTVFRVSDLSLRNRSVDMEELII